MITLRIFYIIIITILSTNLAALENCKWNNNKGIPCTTISKTPNTSAYNAQGINKKVFKKVKLRCKTGLSTTELLAKARRKKFRIKEIGVNHYPRMLGKPVFEMDVGLNLPKPKVVLNLLEEMLILWFDIYIRREKE